MDSRPFRGKRSAWPKNTFIPSPICTPYPRRPQHTCALLPLGGGQLFAGGADRVIRYWDAAWPERSYQVAGPMWPGPIIDPSSGLLNVPQTQRIYQKRQTVGGVGVLDEVAVPVEPRQVRLDAVPDLAVRMRTQDACHADAITALLAAEGMHGRILFSASRDGAVKAWK